MSCCAFPGTQTDSHLKYHSFLKNNVIEFSLNSLLVEEQQKIKLIKTKIAISHYHWTAQHVHVCYEIPWAKI